MERKKTILTAIFINAGLLAVLFVAALTMQDKHLIVADGELKDELLEKPLYSGAMDMVALSQAPIQEEFAALPLLQLPLADISPKVEEPITHHLPPVAVSAPAPVSTTEVTVKKGDSLEKIAKGCSVSVEDLMQMNHLANSALKVGQILKIPSEKMPVAAVKPKQIAVQTPDYYTVKVGDNPWTIAMKHHMKVEELLRVNSLNEEKARKLKPGDRLRIR